MADWETQLLPLGPGHIPEVQVAIVSAHNGVQPVSPTQEMSVPLLLHMDKGLAMCVVLLKRLPPNSYVVEHAARPTPTAKTVDSVAKW